MSDTNESSLAALIGAAMQTDPNVPDPRGAANGVLLAAFAAELPEDSPHRAKAERLVLGMNLSDEAREVGSRMAGRHGMLSSEGRLTDLGRIQSGFLLHNYSQRDRR